jgi:hypothetical protein
LVPYSYPDLPTLQENLSNHLRSQLNEAEAVLSAELDAGPSRSWFLPPGGRLDLETLNELQSEKTGRHTFISARALDPLTAVDGGGCPEPALTFACPISVETGSAKTSGFVLDTDLQLLANELENTDEPRVALQRLFAETAMIREELPSRGDRIIDLVLPGLWSPSPAVERELLTGLRDAPWLSTRTPKEGLAAMRSLSVEPNTRRILSKLPAPSGSPDISLAPIFEADTALQKFGSVQPPAPLLQRLTRNVLVSESRAWWGDAALQQRGDSYATESTAEAGRELGKITIGKNPSEVRLTSRTAKVPIVVFNEAAYRVAVTVHLESELLQIDETFSETIQAHSLRQLDVDVTVPAQSSGIFPLSVTVETPEGEVIASRPDIRVRSTEFNQIALGLTFGALAFLILFYVTRSIRRRRTGTSEPAQA